MSSTVILRDGSRKDSVWALTRHPNGCTGSAEEPGLDPRLGHGAVQLACDDVRGRAGPVRDCLDELGPFVDQADTVVGGVRGRQVTALDQSVQQRPALLLG